MDSLSCHIGASISHDDKLGARNTEAHLDREGLEAHEAKVLDERAYRHVQRRVPRRLLGEQVLEVGQVLDFGVKVEIEVCGDNVSTAADGARTLRSGRVEMKRKNEGMYNRQRNNAGNAWRRGHSPRSPYCWIRSIFDRTFIWGSSRCSIARSESMRTEMYFDASVT